MIALLVGLAAAHSERAVERAPVAWALAVRGQVERQDGTWLDPGESIEVGARMTIPAGAWATVAHGGRIVRWEGPGEVHVGPIAVRVTLGGARVRQPHVEEVPNALTGNLRAPAGSSQVVSALGIPLTKAAWARQDAIDGGMLRALYRDVLEDRLLAAGVTRDQVHAMGLLDALPGDGAEQVALVGRYLDLAGATPDAALVVDVPPTHMNRDSVRRHLGGTLGDLVGGGGPHTFRVDEELDQVRLYAEDVADALRRRGHAVFGIVLPYANTVENIVARSGKPADGVENLHQLLVRAGGASSPVPTVVVGYSQGAAVIRGYLDRYGDADGLDYAIPLATMGGIDGAGSAGVWSGRRGAVRGDGVEVLAISHPRDPARWVYGKGLLAMLPGLTNFDAGGKPRGEDVKLHLGYYGPASTPIPGRADPKSAVAAGLHGYPTAYLAPLYDDLFAGVHGGTWASRGAWEWDARTELIEASKGDFVTTQRQARVVADGYRPVAAEAEATLEAAPTPAPSR